MICTTIILEFIIANVILKNILHSLIAFLIPMLTVFYLFHFEALFLLSLSFLSCCRRQLSLSRDIINPCPCSSTASSRCILPLGLVESALGIEAPGADCVEVLNSPDCLDLLKIMENTTMLPLVSFILSAFTWCWSSGASCHFQPGRPRFIGEYSVNRFRTKLNLIRMMFPNKWRRFNC